LEVDEGTCNLVRRGTGSSKLKTKSSAKKRFKISATGKVMMAQAGKRHGMIKRTNSQIRKLRGTTAMSKQDGKIVKSYMPYSLRG
jgi:large subunit ribosomal protein L35